MILQIITVLFYIMLIHSSISLIFALIVLKYRFTKSYFQFIFEKHLNAGEVILHAILHPLYILAIIVHSIEYLTGHNDSIYRKSKLYFNINVLSKPCSNIQNTNLSVLKRTLAIKDFSTNDLSCVEIHPMPDEEYAITICGKLYKMFHNARECETFLDDELDKILENEILLRKLEKLKK